MQVSNEVAKYWGLEIEKVKYEDQFYIKKDDPDYAEYKISYRSNIFKGFSGASFQTYAYGKDQLEKILKELEQLYSRRTYEDLTREFSLAEMDVIRKRNALNKSQEVTIGKEQDT